MPEKRTNKYLILFFCMTLVLVSCSRYSDLNVNAPSDSYRKAGDFIGNNYDLALFYAGLKHAGLIDVLNGKGPFTVFAPTDEAFHAIGIRSVSDFSKMDKDSLRSILGCHILTQALRIEDIPEKSINNLYPTIAGTQAEIASPSRERKPEGGLLTVDAAINGVRLKKTNVVLFNGLLHTIGNVIKYDAKKNIQQQLENMPQFRILVAGLKKTGRWSLLREPGPYMIVAARDDVFIKDGVDLQTVNTMLPEISDWYFAPYIFKNKALYLNDLNVFEPKDISDGAPHELLSVYGDLRYMLWLNNVPSYRILASQFSRIVNFAQWANCNYKTANGIIHEIAELPLRMGDADKMKQLKNSPKK